MLQLSEEPKTSKFTETESRLEVTRDWAEGNFDECTIVVLREFNYTNLTLV